MAPLEVMKGAVITPEVAVKVSGEKEGRVEVTEMFTGAEVTVRVRVHFHQAAEAPVCGFLIRNRHGIHIYGTNTDLQQEDIGATKPGENIEVSFAFNCWLAPGSYSLTFAVHSVDGISFDWLDGALFFNVISQVTMEGTSNLNATASCRRLGVRSASPSAETVNVERRVSRRSSAAASSAPVAIITR